jgi:plastocyanin
MSGPKFSERREAVSTPVLAGIVVVVIVIAGVGAYLTLGSSPHASSSTTGETSSSTAAHPPTNTTPSPSSASTSSTSSSSPSATTSTSSALDFVIGSKPDTILMTPGSTVTYPVLTFTLTPSSSGSETVTLSSTAPSGLALTFPTNSVKLSSGTLHQAGTPDATALMKINSSQSVTPGVYDITVVVKYGTNSTTYDLQVNVVKYLVTIPNNLEQFSPENLTVTPGSTVFWINLDKDNTYDVAFTSGSSAQSGPIEPAGTFSYTFTSTGTYSYFSSLNPVMTGTITVTENG